MRIKVSDPGAGAEVWRDVPDEPIQKFLNWLMTANRWRYDANPDLTVEAVNKLRAALWRAVREAEAKAQGFPDDVPAPKPRPPLATKGK